MLDKEILNQYRNDAQGLARYFSEQYFKEHEKVFPINPFQVLTDLGIHFVFADKENDFNALYEYIFKALIRAHVELATRPKTI